VAKEKTRELTKTEYNSLAKQMYEDGVFNMMIEDIVVWRKHQRQPSVRLFLDEKKGELHMYGIDEKTVDKTLAAMGKGTPVRGTYVNPPSTEEIQQWLVGQIPRVHALPGGKD
jgi:hypothetical protein